MKEPVFLIFGNNHRDAEHVQNLNTLITHYSRTHEVIFVGEEPVGSNIKTTLDNYEIRLGNIERYIKMLGIDITNPNKAEAVSDLAKTVDDSNPIKAEYRRLQLDAAMYDKGIEYRKLLLRLQELHVHYCTPSTQDRRELSHTDKKEDGRKMEENDRTITEGAYKNIMEVLPTIQSTATKPILIIANFGMAHTQTLMNILSSYGHDYVFGLNIQSSSFATNPVKLGDISWLPQTTKLREAQGNPSFEKPINSQYTAEINMSATYEDMLRWSVQKNILSCRNEEIINELGFVAVD